MEHQWAEAIIGVAGFVLTALIGIVGYFVRDLHKRFERHMDNAAVESLTLERLGAQIVATNKRLDEYGDDFGARLDRIEAKLDRLIERPRS